jgi:hypothetical protein
MGKLEQTMKSEIVRLAKREIHQVSVPLTQELCLMRNTVSQIRRQFLRSND